MLRRYRRKKERLAVNKTQTTHGHKVKYYVSACAVLAIVVRLPSSCSRRPSSELRIESK